MHRFRWLQTIAAFAAAFFIVGLLFVGSFIPDPSPFQAQVYKTVIAIMGAGLASTIPGMVEVKFESISGKVARASAALAAFVILYFFIPI